jgi:mono/diheme cytochrome c family protein
MQNRITKTCLGLGLLVALTGLGFAGCGTTTPAGVVGNAQTGATEFATVCANCHTPAQIKPFSFLIRTNMSTLNAAMTGITLTDQQIADLQAFLATQ